MTGPETDTVTAVLDRIVDGEHAVLLVEGEDRDGVVDELTVDVERLPADGRHEGAVFDVALEDGEFSDAEYRPERTRRRRESAQDRFDRLSERLPDEGSADEELNDEERDEDRNDESVDGEERE